MTCIFYMGQQRSIFFGEEKSGRGGAGGKKGVRESAYQIACGRGAV